IAKEFAVFVAAGNAETNCLGGAGFAAEDHVETPGDGAGAGGRVDDAIHAFLDGGDGFGCDRKLHSIGADGAGGLGGGAGDVDFVDNQAGADPGAAAADGGGD